MKDAKHHLKHVQKKVMKSVKKESPKAQPIKVGQVEFKRPKTIPNKRKIA
jgi:hypothetical protein